MTLANTVTITNKPLPPAHVHTDTCWRENLVCAEDHIARLYRRIYDKNIALAKAQNAIREAKSALDKAEAALTRELGRDTLER